MNDVKKISKLNKKNEILYQNNKFSFSSSDKKIKTIHNISLFNT